MSFKIIMVLCFIGIAAAMPQHGLGGAKGNSNGNGNGGDHGHHEEHFAPAHYEFHYNVEDEKTHDIKEQKETRDGYKVEGYYWLLEPETGHRRLVHYTSDKHTGFQAHVERDGHIAHPHGKSSQYFNLYAKNQQ